MTTTNNPNVLAPGFSIESLAEYEHNAECEVCGQSIFRSRAGTFAHQGNTTASPETCWFPNGQMTTGRPAGYVFDYVTRTWHHPAMTDRRIGG